MLKVERVIEPNVFYKAEAFHLAAKFLNDHDLLSGRGGPFIVNAMFALELYLKSALSATIFDDGVKSAEGVTQYEKVYSKSNFKGKGHDLNLLFNQIPEVLKAELDLLSHESHHAMPLTEFFIKYKHHFIEWRYSYEGKSKAYTPHDILQVLSVLNTWGKYYLGTPKNTLLC